MASPTVWGTKKILRMYECLDDEISQRGSSVLGPLAHFIADGDAAGCRAVTIVFVLQGVEELRKELLQQVLEITRIPTKLSRLSVKLQVHFISYMTKIPWDVRCEPFSFCTLDDTEVACALSEEQGMIPACTPQRIFKLIQRVSSSSRNLSPEQNLDFRRT